MQFTQAKTGFTLIELAIVLVIIGLIIAGILAGKDLILSAKRNAGARQITQYLAATNTFQSKYGYLPGDYPKATSMWPSATGNGNGDGDGEILSKAANATGVQCLPGVDTSTEISYFWKHLSLAQLIANDFSNITSSLADSYPEAKLADGAYFMASCIHIADQGNNYAPLGILTGNGNFFLLAMGNSPSSFNHSRLMYIISGGYGNYQGPQITSADSEWLDSKMDDGMPNKGKIIAVTGCNNNQAQYTPDVSNCVNVLSYRITP